MSIAETPEYTQGMPSPQTTVVDTIGERDTGGIGGHPRGLTTLFFTEFWERFSFYGMRAFLLYYIVAAVNDGGLGFAQDRGTAIVGNYGLSVYALSIPGGIIADRLLGARLAVLLGGILIAMGHFSLAFHSLPLFYTGLGLIAVGTGFLKPNVSTMVGGLYGQNDSRRDSGFSLFYMGINLGAFVGPLLAGYLAQGEGFKRLLASMGMNPNNSWHFGFAAAGVGMTLGLTQYVVHRKRLAHVGLRPAKRKDSDAAPGSSSAGSDRKDSRLTADDWKRVIVIGILFIFAWLFWTGYEQAPTSFSLFADRLTRNSILRFNFPPSWFQSVPAIFVIILAPVFSVLWLKMGKREPSSPAKFSYGLLFLGLSFLLLVPASTLSASGRVSPLWLVGVYFLQTIGELCLSPVGLSTVTKLAHAKIVGLMMGLWFLALALGDKMAGVLGGFFSATDTDVLVKLFGYFGVGALIAAAILALMTPWVRKLMGGVH